MTLYELINGGLPDYYPTMYLDGYTPEQILQAAHKTMLKKDMPEVDSYEVHLSSEVKVKK